MCTSVYTLDGRVCSIAVTSPEVNGAQSNQHAGQNRGLLPQHDGSVVIEPPVRWRGAHHILYLSRTTRIEKMTTKKSGIRVNPLSWPGGSCVSQSGGHVFGQTFLHQRHSNPRPSLWGNVRSEYKNRGGGLPLALSSARTHLPWPATCWCSRCFQCWRRSCSAPCCTPRGCTPRNCAVHLSWTSLQNLVQDSNTAVKHLFLWQQRVTARRVEVIIVSLCFYGRCQKWNKWRRFIL